MNLVACPATQLLSAYLDGEVVEPLASALEHHLESCRRCEQHLRGFQNVSHQLLEDQEPDVRTAASLVWSRLDVVDSETALSFWRRLISVPAPLVFAAMATLLLLAGALAARVTGQRAGPTAAFSNATPALQLAAPLDQIERIIGGLNAAARPLVIELPLESEFHFVGQPAILRPDELAGALR
jgi:anti-sigma factor RsiW